MPITTLNPFEITTPLLYLGRRGTGRTKQAQYYLSMVSQFDQWALLDFTSRKALKELIAWSIKVPVVSDYKLAVIDLDKMYRSTMDVLLKLLEKAPSKFRMILLASETPPATILSRCFVIRFEGYANEEIALTMEEEFDPSVAGESVAYANGSMFLARQYCSSHQEFIDAESVATKVEAGVGIMPEAIRVSDSSLAALIYTLFRRGTLNATNWAILSKDIHPRLALALLGIK